MEILLISAFALPVALYLAAWLIGFRPQVSVFESASEDLQTQTTPSSRLFSGVSALLLVAMLVHLASLYLGIVQDAQVRFGFAHIVSAAILIGVLLLWIEGDSPHVSAMRVLVLPLAAFAVPLPLLFHGAVLGELANQPLFVPHLIVGTLAYSVLLLAVTHALLMAGAERALHGRKQTGPSGLVRFFDKLPPLLTMERILFRLIVIGFVLLSLTVFSGLLFSEQIFGRPTVALLTHKSIFTLIAWAVFGVLLLGRRVRGWRGRTALRLTLGGFVVMLLGYVGSRFVLEVVLHRV